MHTVGQHIPEFTVRACCGIEDTDLVDLTRNTFAGMWTVFAFLPHDNAGICASELIGFAQHVHDFERRRCVILGASADTDLELAIQALQQGAYDYIVKAGAFLKAVPLIVEKNLETWRMRQENLRLSAQLHQTLRMVQRKNDQLEDAVSRLKTAAGTDPLTGLANRRSFGQAFERSFAECSRQDRDLACMMIDIDGFKELNDTLGHPCGDELLQRVARVLEANCRRSDVAGRFGGDEFILLLPETDVEFATKVADRIRQEFDLSVQAMFRRIDAELHLSLSQGLATLRVARPINPSQMIAYADHALYRAKQAGKARIIVHDGPEDQPRKVHHTPGAMRGVDTPTEPRQS